jgi:hypothetical protein
MRKFNSDRESEEWIAKPGAGHYLDEKNRRK